MKHMKKRRIPARTEDVVAKVTCDICGAEINERHGYDIDKITVERKTGSCYPEGGNNVRVTVDLCGDCFDGKLLPWLKTQGAVPATAETDW